MSENTNIIRRFNDKGIAAFREYLVQARQNPSLPPPMELLTDPEKTVVAPGPIPLSRPAFQTKRQAAEYLQTLLKPLSGGDLFKDLGLWSWLALYYFDDICPAKNGRRKVLQDPHYVLETEQWRRRYRHLLASPLLVLTLMPEHNKLLLDKEINVFGDVIEQLMSRFFIIRVGGVPEALERLYWDQQKQQPKIGITPKKPKKGDLRNRFVTRIEQLSRTYDVTVVNGEGLLKLLGSEFDAWSKPTSAKSN